MSRWRRLMPRTLAGKFLLFQLGVVGLVLMVAGAVSVRQSTSQFASSSGDRVLGAAENVAGNPLVKRDGQALNPATELAPTAEAARIQSGATVVLLTDVDRQIITSTDPTLIGTTLTLPDDSAWTGRSWDGDLTLGGERLIAASVPIYSDSGGLIGLALVGEEYPDTWSILRSGRARVAAADSAGRVGRGGRVLAARPPGQEADPWPGAGPDRQPGRPPGGVAAQHPRGCARCRTDRAGHRRERRRSIAARPAGRRRRPRRRRSRPGGGSAGRHPGRPHRDRPGGRARRPGAGGEPANRTHRRPVRSFLRNRDNPAGSVGTDCRATTIGRHPERHRHPAGADP